MDYTGTRFELNLLRPIRHELGMTEMEVRHISDREVSLSRIERGLEGIKWGSLRDILDVYGYELVLRRKDDAR